MKHDAKSSSLRAYFQSEQMRVVNGTEHRRDTMRAMAKRHGVTMQTIWRVKNNQPTSYGLARELADKYDIEFDSFTIVRPMRRKAFA